MRPANFILDPAHLTGLDSVFSGNQALQSGIGAYCEYLICGQFGGGALLTTVRGSVLSAIHLISGCGIPTQVGERIVTWVAIIVTRLMAGRRIATKSEQNKAMNFHHSAFVFPPKEHRQSSIFEIWRWCFEKPSFDGSDTATVGHVVQALKTNNRFPMLHTSTIPQIGT